MGMRIALKITGMATSLMISLFVLVLMVSQSVAHNSPDLVGQLRGINEVGPHMGILVQSTAQLKALLGSENFVPDDCDYVDIFARRFHLGWFANKRVVIVVTGSNMLNAGVTTQLIITLFNLDGIIHYGRAGNANTDYNIGDMVISYQWAHVGLWYWQRYGSGEESGWYTKDIGYLDFDAYNSSGSCGNSLNKVWFQYEEIFSVSGPAEVAQEIFWVNITDSYYAAAEKLEEVTLEACLNSTTCLSVAPKVARVERGCTANIYVDNKSYRNFLSSTFNCTALDEDSAASAIVAWSNKMPYISIRSLANLAGEASSASNDYAIFSSVEKHNLVQVIYEFILSLTPESFPPVPSPVESAIEVIKGVEATKFLGYSLW